MTPRGLAVAALIAALLAGALLAIFVGTTGDPEQPEPTAAGPAPAPAEPPPGTSSEPPPPTRNPPPAETTPPESEEDEPSRELGTVFGTVRAKDGGFVANCRVALTHGPRQRSIGRTTTTGAGYFELVDVPLDSDYRLRVTPPEGYREEFVSFALELASREIPIVVKREGDSRLTLALENTDGEPITGLGLRVRGAADLRGGVQANTDATGHVDFDAAPSGALLIESATTPRVTVSGIRIEAGDRTATEVVAAVGGYEIRGSVVSGDDGAPLIGIRVRAVWTMRDGPLRSSVTATAQSDRSGRFTLSGLGRGQWELSAAARDYRPARAKVEVPGEGEVRLELRAVR